MLLAYIDESYSKSRYHLAGLLVPEHEALALTDALDEVVAGAAAAHGGVQPNAELHGYELFHGNRDWAGLADKPRARIGVYQRALEAVVGRDVAIVLRGVRSDRLMFRSDPHSLALAHLLERIDEHAELVNEWVIAIADEVDDQHQHRRSLRQFQLFWTPGYRARKIHRIVDTLHFVPSHASRLVQGADLIAFLYNRRRNVPEEPDARQERVMAQLWALLEPAIVHRGTWTPQ